MDRADIRGAINDAIEYLAQYQRYAEAMRAIGRGFNPSGPYSVDSLMRQLGAALTELR